MLFTKKEEVRKAIFFYYSFLFLAQISFLFLCANTYISERTQRSLKYVLSPYIHTLFFIHHANNTGSFNFENNCFHDAFSDEKNIKVWSKRTLLEIQLVIRKTGFSLAWKCFRYNSVDKGLPKSFLSCLMDK